MALGAMGLVALGAVGVVTATPARAARAAASATPGWWGHAAGRDALLELLEFEMQVFHPFSPPF